MCWALLPLLIFRSHGVKRKWCWKRNPWNPSWVTYLFSLPAVQFDQGSTFSLHLSACHCYGDCWWIILGMGSFGYHQSKGQGPFQVVPWPQLGQSEDQHCQCWEACWCAVSPSVEACRQGHPGSRHGFHSFPGSPVPCLFLGFFVGWNLFGVQKHWAQSALQ